MKKYCRKPLSGWVPKHILRQAPFLRLLTLLFAWDIFVLDL